MIENEKKDERPQRTTSHLGVSVSNYNINPLRLYVSHASYEIEDIKEVLKSIKLLMPNLGLDETNLKTMTNYVKNLDRITGFMEKELNGASKEILKIIVDHSSPIQNLNLNLLV